MANTTSEFQFAVWPCPPPSFSGSWARPRQHNSNRLMLVLSAGWSFRDSVAAPSERLLDAPRAELFSVSPERACGLSPSRCRHDILIDRPLHEWISDACQHRSDTNSLCESNCRLLTICGPWHNATEASGDYLGKCATSKHRPALRLRFACPQASMNTSGQDGISRTAGTNVPR